MEKHNEGKKTKGGRKKGGSQEGRQESSPLLDIRGAWLGGQQTGSPVWFQSVHPAQAMKMQIRKESFSLPSSVPALLVNASWRAKGKL